MGRLLRRLREWWDDPPMEEFHNTISKGIQSENNKKVFSLIFLILINSSSSIQCFRLFDDFDIVVPKLDQHFPVELCTTIQVQ